MKTVHFFAFYTHNLPKNTFFCSTEFYEPQKYKIFTIWRGRMGMFCHAFSFKAANQSSSDAQSVFFKCAINPFQMRNQSFSNFRFRIFEFLLLLLWCFVPAFRMIYPCFYDEVVQYRLNPHGYGFDFVSDVDCNIFLPRIRNFQAEKIIVSGRENFMLNTRIHFIPYENEVHSGKEWSVFS